MGPHPRRGALAALLATALLGACGGDGSNGDRITAAAVARTTAKAGGVHVVETVSFPPFGLPGAKPTSMSAEGVYDFANRRGAFRVRMDVDGKPVEADVRWIGSRQYLRLTSTPGALGTLVPTTPTKPWLAMESQASQSGGGLLGSFGMETDPADVLDGLRRSATAVDVVGHERVRGAATTHERLELDPAKLPPSLVGDEAPPASTDRAVADAWVDADGRLRRLRTTLPATPALTLDIEMWDYGTDVHVDAPPADQVTPFDPTRSATPGARRDARASRPRPAAARRPRRTSPRSS